MTTMDERIEAAARAEYATMPYLDEEGEVIPWEDLHENVRVGRCNEMRPFIAAAFPELQGDKPTHWLAPIEPTLEMELAADRFDHRELPSRGYQHFVAMRDAYLGKGGGG